MAIHICQRQFLSNFFHKTNTKRISYQISTSYNELYLFNSGISGWERDREKDREKEREKAREREREREKRNNFEFQNILCN